MVRYARYSDNVARGATITVVTGTEDPAYPAQNLATDNPAVWPAKLTSTSGCWQFAFAAPQRVDGIVLVHANLAAGLAVRLRGRATPTGSDIVNEAITIPAYHGDKFPTNAVLDLSGSVSGTPVAGYSTSGCQYWRLDVTGTNPVTLSIGEVLLLSHWRTLPDLQTKPVMRPRRPIINNRTPLKVASKFDQGCTVWEFEADLMVRGTAVADLDTLWEDAYGALRPWTWWPAPETGGEPFLVTFSDDAKDLTYVSETSEVRLRTMRIRLEEVGRGLIPTPSAV